MNAKNIIEIAKEVEVSPTTLLKHLIKYDYNIKFTDAGVPQIVDEREYRMLLCFYADGHYWTFQDAVDYINGKGYQSIHGNKLIVPVWKTWVHGYYPFLRYDRNRLDSTLVKEFTEKLMSYQNLPATDRMRKLRFWAEENSQKTGAHKWQ